MVNKHLAEAGAAGGTSLAVGSSDDGGTSLAVGSSVDSSASNLAICPPPGVAGDEDDFDYGRTKEVFLTLRGDYDDYEDNEKWRSRVLGVWQDLPDGAGRWCFTQPGADGQHLFYKFMARSNVALAFECPKWDQVPVVLEVWTVLCWCPQGYVWPYCMFCHKFCFPYNGSGCHRESRRHLRRVGDWRERKSDLVLSSLDLRFRFFVL